MKKILILIGISMLLGSPLHAKQITNKSNIEGSANIATDGGRSQMGSIRLSSKTVTKDGIINNNAKIKGGVNLSQGKGSVANMGSIDLKDTTVKGKVSNKADIEGSANMALDGGKANMGSIDLQGGKIEGDVNNKSKVTASMNAAVGEGSVSNMGTVNLQNTNLKRGATINNKADITGSMNISADGGQANMGSVHLKNANVYSTINNDAKITGGMNIAVGEGSEASMGSITDGE